MGSSSVSVSVGGMGTNPNKVTHNVFVYGSLLADEVVSILLNRVPPSSPALLNNHHRFSIKGRVYPAILPVENKKVTGKVLLGITSPELDILDTFEDVEYERRTVDVSLLVKQVYYPGLQSHPEHHIAKQQMTGFGGVVSFEIDGNITTTIKFVDSLKIPYIAPSFGGCESIVDQPAIMSYWDLSQADRAKYGIMDNLVRFSFGVEEFEDLKADILQALETI